MRKRAPRRLCNILQHTARQYPVPHWRAAIHSPLLTPKLLDRLSKFKGRLIALEKCLKVSNFIDLKVTDDVTGKVKVRVIEVLACFWTLVAG